MPDFPQIYRHDGHGAIKLAGTVNPADTLQEVQERLEEAAAEIECLREEGWELEQPMRGAYGLISQTTGMEPQ